jgi:hypothetical protein
MPARLNNPAHWHLRAQEARLLAAQLEDPEAQTSILRMAHEYDRLAVRAAQRLQDQAANRAHQLADSPHSVDDARPSDRLLPQ